MGYIRKKMEKNTLVVLCAHDSLSSWDAHPSGEPKERKEFHPQEWNTMRIYADLINKIL